MERCPRPPYWRVSSAGLWSAGDAHGGDDVHLGRAFTQDEFERLCEEGRLPSEIHRYELIRGRIVMSPPASCGHGAIEHRLHLRVGAHVVARRLGRVFGSGTGLALPTGDTLEPDLCFVSPRACVPGLGLVAEDVFEPLHEG
jgi:hypothetical protein